MKRIDFLYLLLACSILIRVYANGGEIWAFSACMLLLIFYAILAWAQFEEIRLLLLLMADNEKHKDLTNDRG